MIFDVPALIECLSSTMTFRPGTVILTGRTPSGVGFARNPPISGSGPGTWCRWTSRVLGRLRIRSAEAARSCRLGPEAGLRECTFKSMVPRSLVFMLVCAGIGYFLGRTRGMGLQGFFFGLAFGPLGCALILLLAEIPVQVRASAAPIPLRGRLRGKGNPHGHPPRNPAPLQGKGPAADLSVRAANVRWRGRQDPAPIAATCSSPSAMRSTIRSTIHRGGEPVTNINCDRHALPDPGAGGKDASWTCTSCCIRIMRR